jgi:hypothetical protein
MSATGDEAGPSAAKPDGPGAAWVSFGLVAVLVGVGSAIASDQVKLDVEKVLNGGAYVKDGYRAFMTFGGITLAILGVVLIVLAAASANRATARPVFALTIALIAIVAVGDALILTAYSKGSEASRSSEPVEPAPEGEYEDFHPEPEREARGDEVVSCGSGGCFGEDGTPVTVVNDGDPCIDRDGVEGWWRGNDLGNEYHCESGDQ